MLTRLHVLSLRTYQRLPVWARRRVVRTIAPGFIVGSMCFVTREDGRVLLVRHLYRRDWGVPGGLLQRGEEPDDAARRETFEEVGLAVDLGAGDPAVQVDSEARRVDVIFVGAPASGVDPDDVGPRSPEILEARWFSPDDLPSLQAETAGALAILGRRDRGAVNR